MRVARDQPYLYTAEIFSWPQWTRTDFFSRSSYLFQDQIMEFLDPGPCSWSYLLPFRQGLPTIEMACFWFGPFSGRGSRPNRHLAATIPCPFGG